MCVCVCVCVCVAGPGGGGGGKGGLSLHPVSTEGHGQHVQASGGDTVPSMTYLH